MGWLVDKLMAFGEDGWELVTSVSTNKVVAALGNELVFVFKKPGAGHRPKLREEGVGLPTEVHPDAEGGQFGSETVGSARR